MRPIGDGERHGHPGTPSLYADMLPLVEAGATVEQAARRFGADADEVREIADGFIRWRDGGAGGQESDDDHAAASLAEARRRIAGLEDENRALRRRLADLRELLERARTVITGD
jgi:transposase-like protein